MICTYHLKTLMLWACERKSPVWWESNCVLELCSKLLDTLMKWIGKKHCPHYFIPEWNLLDFTMKESRYVNTIETLRILVNIRNLSECFRINYVSRVFISQQCVNAGRQHLLNAFAASNQFDKNFQKSFQNWAVERIHWSLFITHESAVMTYCSTKFWFPEQYSMLIASRKLAPDLQCLNLAVA